MSKSHGCQHRTGPLSYKIVKWIFSLATNFFYHVEVYGAKSLPPTGPGQKHGTILCANHGNSLMDACMVLSVSPGFTRLTAKDNLWRDPYFGWLVRGAGTLPIQRRAEHGSAADNTKTMQALHDALEEGGTVCLFPEGISRYMSGIAPMKSGVAHMVLTILEKKAAAGEDFTMHIVPVGIAYMNREKFRSDVAVTFTKALSYKTSQLKELVIDGDKQAAAKRIMGQVSRALWSNTLSSIDWDTLRAAIVAHHLYAPLGTRISLYQHLHVTRGFLDGLSAMPEAERRERLLRRSMSDPDVPRLGLAGDEGAREAAELKRDLLSYSRELEALGVSDDILSKGQFFWRKRLALWSLGWSVMYMLLALPGVLLISPVLGAAKLSEVLVVRHNRGEKKIRNVDEVAQWKLLTSLPLGLIMICVGIRVVKRVMPLVVAMVAVPVWIWLTVMLLEASIVSLNTCYSAVCAIIKQKRIPPLMKSRAVLSARVQALAQKLGIPAPEKLLADADPEGARHSRYWIRRWWQRNEWGEVMRIGDRSMDVYPEKMLRKYPIPTGRLGKDD